MGIGTNENLRDHLTLEELRAIQSMECLVSGLVDCGWGYEQVKDFIQQNNTMRITAVKTNMERKYRYVRRKRSINRGSIYPADN